MPVMKTRKNGSLVVTLRLTLRPDRDDDLIKLVRNAPHGSLAKIVRETMRTGISAPETSGISRLEDESLDASALDLDL